jgi:hypothetical protein
MNMAVTIHFADGRTEDFPRATSATNRGPILTVASYDKAKRDLVEVKSFMANEVAMAEVFENGVLSRLVNGSGRRSSN